MPRASKEQYLKLMEDRPEKWAPEDVDYRRAGKEEPHCSKCIHMYKRVTDGFAVCELIRDDEIDRNGIDPVWTCDFYSPDGEEFPLLGER